MVQKHNIISMKKQYIIYLIIALMVIPFQSNYSQETEIITIGGIVVDGKGEALSNVSITAGIGSDIIRTDAEGSFNLEVKANEKVSFILEGYKKQYIEPYQLTDNARVVLEPILSYFFDGEVNMPYHTQDFQNISSEVSVVNPNEILEYNRERNILSSLNGVVPGLFGFNNIRGIGNAVTVVDGMPRYDFSINLEEVEQITVLKDAPSRILYGAQADMPVILITTKRGSANRRYFNINLETGVEAAISLPEYLPAAEYMELYNEALENDGMAPRYTQEQINNTRNKVDNVLYPDEDYYNDTYLNYNSLLNTPSRSFYRINAEGAGGNETATYYANIGIAGGGSYLDLGQGANANNTSLNVRGNVDYQLNKIIKAKLDAIAVFNFGNLPNEYDPQQSNNGRDFWEIAGEYHPDYYPILIPADRIEDQALVESAELIDGKYFLGGTSEYQTNAYGNLTRSGYKEDMLRVAQINTGLDFDLSRWISGLSLDANLTFDLYNYLRMKKQNDYAVYEPIVLQNMAGQDSLVLVKINEDTKRTDPSLDQSVFLRNVGFYSTIKYKKIVNDLHDIQLLGLAYTDTRTYEGQVQPEKNLTFAHAIEYAFDKRYVVNFNGAVVGSPKLYNSDKFSYSPSIAAAWNISNEDFFSMSFVNFLTLKASWGIIKSTWGTVSGRGIDYDGVHLTENTFYSNGRYTYNDGKWNNSGQEVLRGNPDLTWEKRREVNLGIKTVLLDNLMIEVNYFNSLSYDQVVSRDNSYPSTLGEFIYENYEEFEVTGVELGINYRKNIGEFTYQLGVNMSTSNPIAVQVDEPDYVDAYRQRSGKDADAIFGLVSEGLYTTQDFIDGELNDDLPTPTFGAVSPGDIKYRDLNDDGFINDDDKEKIGNSMSRFQYGFNLMLGYKGFTLYTSGTGQNGANVTYSNEYYWVYGNRKYSEVARNRWTGDGDDEDYPRLTSQSSPNNFQQSTFWLEDKNFFNLNVVQISYNLSTKVTNKVPFKHMKIYLRGTNLARISENKEREQLNVKSEPQSRTYSIGLTTTF